MRFDKLITAIDAHVAGEPIRVITSGLPHLPGSSVAEKRRHMERHHDRLRTALMHEPRGHKDMYGAVLVPPVHPDADLGVFFMDGSEYLPMCGHGSIGVATVAVETGLVPATEPETTLTMETPAGLVTARARLRDASVESVTIRNVPSFLHTADAHIRVPGLSTPLTLDVAYGGAFFALVDAEPFGQPLDAAHVHEWIAWGLAVKQAVNEQMEVRHPDADIPLRGVELVELHAPPMSPGSDARSLTVFGDGQADRSPCGTGTSAVLAARHARSQIGLNDPFVNESVLGTRFTGRLVAETTVGPYRAVVPEITGSAWIVGFHQFVLDNTDPLGGGFRLQGVKFDLPPGTVQRK